MTELPQRRRLRLEDFDYSSSGMYFLTICTHEKQCLFSEIVGSIHESTGNAPITCVLTEYGKTVDTMLHMLPLQFENVRITDAIIMPNHVHLIVDISSVNDIRAIRESPLRREVQDKRSELSKLVGYFKMQVSKQIHRIDPELQVWQRGYYDHVIRDFEDYRTKAAYIATNPLRWLHHREEEAYR